MGLLPFIYFLLQVGSFSYPRLDHISSFPSLQFCRLDHSDSSLSFISFLVGGGGSQTSPRLSCNSVEASRIFPCLKRICTGASSYSFFHSWGSGLPLAGTPPPYPLISFGLGPSGHLPFHLSLILGGHEAGPP